MTRRVYHWNGKKMVEGHAPYRGKVYDRACEIMFDTMPRQYHEAGRCYVESRRDWRLLDKMHGTITLSPNENLAPPDTTADERKQRREDIREARRRAVAAVKGGNAPLTDDQKQLCRRDDERISQQLGYDVSKIWRPKKKTSGLKRNSSKKPKP